MGVAEKKIDREVNEMIHNYKGKRVAKVEL